MVKFENISELDPCMLMLCAPLDIRIHGAV